MEIKFRAKDKDADRWLYGFYVFHIKTLLCCATEKEVEENEEHLLIFDGCCDWNLPMPWYKADVKPETIGQYVGLKDVYGKELYVYDISVDEQGRRWITYMAKGGFRICPVKEWVETEGQPIICEGLSDLQNAAWFEQTHSIIGNMIDNPELMS